MSNNEKDSTFFIKLGFRPTKIANPFNIPKLETIYAKKVALFSATFCSTRR
jgi:hypothetical protein